MKIKCPHCENGCDKCVNGFAEAQFAEGRWYRKICQDCGGNAGGGIQCKENSNPKVNPHAVCPCCGGNNVKIEFEETSPPAGIRG